MRARQEAAAGAEAALAAQRAVNAALMARKQDTEWQLLAALARTGAAPPGGLPALSPGPARAGAGPGQDTPAAESPGAAAVGCAAESGDGSGIAAA